MSATHTPSLYLAHVNPSKKKKGIQTVKALQQRLQQLAVFEKKHIESLVCREGHEGVPYAHELLQGAQPAFPLRYLHLLAEPGDPETQYLNAPGGKRLAMDWDQMVLDQLTELEWVYLDGAASLDWVERFLFAGTKMVIATAESGKTKKATAFQSALYTHLGEGITLQEALEAAGREVGVKMQLFPVPQDPYDYWDFKEAQLSQDAFQWGLYYLPQHEANLAQRWDVPIKEVRVEPEIKTIAPSNQEVEQNEALEEMLSEALQAAHNEEKAGLLAKGNDEVAETPSTAPVSVEEEPAEMAPIQVSLESTVQEIAAEEETPEVESPVIAEAEFAAEPVAIELVVSEAPAAIISADSAEEETPDESPAIAEAEVAAEPVALVSEPDTLIEEGPLPASEEADTKAQNDRSGPGEYLYGWDTLGGQRLTWQMQRQAEQIALSEAAAADAFVGIFEPIAAIEEEELADPTGEEDPALAKGDTTEEESIHSRPKRAYARSRSAQSIAEEATAKRQRFSVASTVGGILILLSLVYGVYQIKSLDPTPPPAQNFAVFLDDTRYNILILPFSADANCVAEEAVAEVAMRDRLMASEERDELGIEIEFLNGMACPANSEEAQRIGEVYHADLVIWGDYTAPVYDPEFPAIRYITLHQERKVDFKQRRHVGEEAFRDIYDLQEGQLQIPSEYLASWVLGAIHLQNEHYHAALSYLQTIPMNGGVGLSNVPHMMARAYQGLEDYEQSLAHFEMAIQLNAENANLFYARGCLRHRLREPDLALADFDEALLLNASHVQAQHERGMVLAGEQPESYFYSIPATWETQEDSLLAEVSDEWTDTGEWEYQSFEALQNNQTRAEASNEAAVSTTPTTQVASVSFTPAPSPAAPARSTTRTTASTSNLANELMQEARRYEREGMEAQAIAIYGEVITEFPKMSKAYFRRGKILEQLGRQEEALSDYDMALEFNKNNTVVLLTRANLLVNSQQVYRAIDDYAQILRLDPGQQTARFQRAQLYTKVRQLDAALIDFNQVIVDRPEWGEPLFYRAQLFVSLGKNEQAREDIAAALRLEPGNRRYRQLSNTLSGT